MMVLSLASFHFADIAAASPEEALNKGVIVYSSLVFFLLAVLAGAGCVALEEV